MADEKDKKKPGAGGGKPPSKPSAPAGGSMEGEIFFFALLGLMLVFIILPTVLQFFGVNFGVNGTLAGTMTFFGGVFRKIFTTVTFLSLFSCLLLGMGVFYAKFRLKETTDFYNSKLSKQKTGAVHPTFQRGGEGVIATRLPGTVASPIVLPVNPRWKNIEQNIQSNNASDWRLGILEADIMLYDMLDQMGYEGQTIGEKLKQANTDTFTTLQDAWRAHKVRNIIAHEGTAFQLSRSQAEETFRLYKKVFDEFFFI